MVSQGETWRGDKCEDKNGKQGNDCCHSNIFLYMIWVRGYIRERERGGREKVMDKVGIRGMKG